MMKKMENDNKQQKMTECARSAVMMDWEIPKHVDIFYKELHRDVRHHFNMFKVYMTT